MTQTKPKRIAISNAGLSSPPQTLYKTRVFSILNKRDRFVPTTLSKINPPVYGRRL